MLEQFKSIMSTTFVVEIIDLKKVMNLFDMIAFKRFKYVLKYLLVPDALNELFCMFKLKLVLRHIIS